MPWNFWAAYLERLATIALVLVALYFAARRFGRTSPFVRSGRRLRLLESMTLSQNAALYVVQVGARFFLIGSAPAGVWALAELAEVELRVRGES
jgi:flagellar biogenesis protein FliO